MIVGRKYRLWCLQWMEVERNGEESGGRKDGETMTEEEGPKYVIAGPPPSVSWLCSHSDDANPRQFSRCMCNGRSPRIPNPRLHPKDDGDEE